MHIAQRILAVLMLLSIQNQRSYAWTTAPTTSFSRSAARRTTTSLERLRPLSSPVSPLSSQAVSLDSNSSTDTADDNNENEDNDDDDDDEYEYVEFDSLAESDFAGSEWLVGTVFENKENDIEENWVRLFVTEEGKNLAFWGDDSKGTWNFDVASQFLTLSKDALFGKRIWACTTDDFYYLQGTVRGWTYLQSARVLAQWQARRLGVDPEEAGVAPWFEVDEEEDEDNNVDESPAAPVSEGIFGAAEGIFGAADATSEETTEA
jgi:hypothetical protein